MSMTLDAIWNIQSTLQQVDVSQSTEFVARRGFRISFAYGPTWLLLLAAAGGGYFQYRKKNPDRFQKFEQRLHNASASLSRQLKTAMDTRAGTGGAQSPRHDDGLFAEGRAVDPTNTASLNTVRARRFNPPPNWPAPPPDWEPPADWRPDPSWPPAPPGWQFWVA